MRIRQAFFWPWLMTAAALAAEPAARVGYVEGDVFIQRAQGGRPERAEVGAALFDGDVLVTKNGRAQMAVPAAGTVRLGRNSTLKPHSGTSDGPRGGITPLVGREHRNVFEVRIPVLVAGGSEAATLHTTALSDSSNLAFGSPVSDEDINRQMALRKVPPVWPITPPPDASRPVIPADCTIIATVWNPEHPEHTAEIVYHIRNNEVTATFNMPRPTGDHIANWQSRFQFDGKLTENRIRGTGRWNQSWDFVTKDYAMHNQSQSTSQEDIVFHVDGTLQSTHSASYKSTYTYWRKPADSKAEDGGNTSRHTVNVAGRWKFGGGGAKDKGN